MILVRRAEAADAGSIRRLGPRLVEGAAPWRPPAGFAAAAQQWLDDSVAGRDEQRPVWVATADGVVVGVATASLREHFSGQLDCYLGELVVDVGHEGRGIGRQLVAAVEDWAAGRGVVRVTLETGAGNRRARGFYASLGYADEQVQLTKVIAGPESASVTADSRPETAPDAVRRLAEAMASRLRTAGRSEQADLLVSAAAGPGVGCGGVVGPPRGDAPPVLQHLSPAVAMARAEGMADLVGPVAELADTASWTQPPGYVDDPPDGTFLDGYAETTVLRSEVSAAASGRRTDAVLLGLLLLAPGTYYPPHQHPADEVYVPLTAARWGDGAGAPRRRPPGSVLHHRPWQPHTMSTDAVPLLAAYLWTGDVAVASRFCAAP